MQTEEAYPLAYRDATLQKKAADLIDHSCPLANQARSYAVQRLQIQLIVGLHRNAACRWPLHGFRDRVGVSEIVVRATTASVLQGMAMCSSCSQAPADSVSR